MRYYNQFLKLIIFFVLPLYASSQDFNNNSSTNFINHIIPKSPESSSFEKYGLIPVSQNTGIPNIQIPLVQLNSHTLNVPVSLSYHASGIKVSQEATWVGLGWDIITGGRITLQVKGGYDKYCHQFLSPEVKYWINYLKNKYPLQHNYSGGVTAPPYCLPDPQNVMSSCQKEADSIYKLTTFAGVINTLIEKGVAEPDIYNANFLGHSVSFYKDIFTDEIKIIGQHSFYRIEDLTNEENRFIITDENGIKYEFSQQEKTNYEPYMAGFFSEVTTAWLLTRISAVNGDYIDFKYTNYGSVLSIPKVSETELFDQSYSFTTNIYGDLNSGQKIFYNPQYLTTIETKNIKILFQLEDRIDLTYGSSKRLNKITMMNKSTQSKLKEIKFNYDYFKSQDNNYYYDTSLLHYGNSAFYNSALNILNLRLKLLSIDIYGEDSSYSDTYKFFYRSESLPNKVSPSIDHWGFYNAQNSNISFGSGLSSAVLTPSMSSLVAEGVLLSSVVPNVQGNVNTYNLDLAQLLPGHANRKANEYTAIGWLLDSIVYPTGGASKFEFELHKSYYSPTSLNNFIGGGLRIKKISSYDGFTSIPTVKQYSYVLDNNNTSGIYKGVISYVRFENKKYEYEIDYGGWATVQQVEFRKKAYLYSNGDLSDGNVVSYSQVIETVSGLESMKVVKTFGTKNPYPPQVINIPTELFLNIPYYSSRETDDILLKEEIYDQFNNLVRETRNYYNEVIVRNEFHGFNVVNATLDLIPNMLSCRYYFDMAKLYRILLDSSVEYTYEKNGSFKSKKSYSYNDFFQPSEIVSYNSKGELLILKQKTPLSYDNFVSDGLYGGDNALYGLVSLKTFNMINVPVEQIYISRKEGEVPAVLKAFYKQYDLIGNVKKEFELETNVPISYSQFNESHYFNGNILHDARYVLKRTNFYIGQDINMSNGLVYQTGAFINQVETKDQITTIITDTFTNKIVAAIDGAFFSETAFTSFESPFKGNWIYGDHFVLDETTPSGSRCYALNYGNSAISFNGLSPSRSYFVSYWTKGDASFTIAGTIPGSVIQGSTVNGWTHYRHLISGQTNISVVGNGLIDELRLNPKLSLMKTFTYDSFNRMIAQGDINNDFIYYKYDKNSRLSCILDKFKNIRRKILYKTSEQKINYDGSVFTNHTQKKSFTKQNCTLGEPEQVEYIVPEGAYTSLISQEDADSKAFNDISLNGQAHANSVGSCVFYNEPVSNTFVRNCPNGYMSNSIFYSIPPKKYVSKISQTHANQLALDELNSKGQQLANQEICYPEPLKIDIKCESLRPSEPFIIELINIQNNSVKSFTFSNVGIIGQVYQGTYNIKIYPVSYEGLFDYMLNGIYEVNGVTIGQFNGFTINSPLEILIY